MPAGDHGIPRLVPASLLRVRRFLNSEGKMKVKPWATAEETLDAFHDSLVANRHNDAFWSGLESLLAMLSHDMKRRAGTSDSEVIENELLDSEAQHRLLSEIRGVLANRERGCGGFRALTSRLSPPAIGLFLMLGGVASQGCYTAETKPDGTDAGSSQVADTGSAETHPGVDAGSADARPADANLRSPVDSAPYPRAARDSGQSARNTVADTSVITSDEDTGAADSCRAAYVNIVDILNSCIDRAGYRDHILTCIDALNRSWQIGLVELFRCEDCSEIREQINDCLLHGYHEACSNPEGAGTFDVDEFLDSCAIPIYVGVRFE